MRIALRGMGARELLADLDRSGVAVLVGGIRGEMFFDARWPDPGLADFLRRAADLGSVEINPWMEFEKGELDQCEFLRPRCRKVVRDSRADFERMRAYLDGRPWLGDDPKRRFRSLDRVCLSTIRLKPNEVGGVGEWTAEYVMGGAVRKRFEGAGLTGFASRPVFRTRAGSHWDEYFQLHADHVLGYRELDIASPEIRSPRPGEQGHEVLGCLCYAPATLQDARDFNRTGEGNVSFEFPDWVVRSRVRACFRQSALRGWAFEPVLRTDSPMYRQYCELWASFYDLLAECELHTIRSQKPFEEHEKSDT